MNLKNPITIGILAGLTGLIGGASSASWYWQHQIGTIHRLYASSEARLALEALKCIKTERVPLATKFLETVLTGRVIQLGKTYQQPIPLGPSEKELLIQIKNFRDGQQVTTALSPQVNMAATEILSQAAR